MSTILRFAAAAVVAAFAASTVAAPSRAAPPRVAGEIVLTGWVSMIEVQDEVPGVTLPSGVILTDAPLTRWPQRIRAYLGQTPNDIVLDDLGGRWCLLRGTLTRDAISSSPDLRPKGPFDAFVVTGARALDDPAFARPPLVGAILRDLLLRDTEYDRDGTETPIGALSPDGRLPDGRRARVVRLVTPPADSADMYSETAYVDPRAGVYWAVREGGFAARIRWVGPFALPRR